MANRSPTTTVADITLEEAWSSRKPTVSYLRTFGCATYMHIRHQQRTKLDKNSLKYIFIGYVIHNKAYRIYDPNTKKMHLSRDVIFAEDNEELESTSIQSSTEKGKQIVEDFLPSQSSTPCTFFAPVASTSAPSTSNLALGISSID